MDIRLSVRDQDGFTRDVALAAPSGAALRDVSDGIASLMPGADGTIALWSGSQRLPPTALLGGPGLRDGGVLQLGRPGARDLTAGAVIRIHVVGGPDAGLIVALPRGVLIVGRSPACEISAPPTAPTSMAPRWTPMAPLSGPASCSDWVIPCCASVAPTSPLRRSGTGRTARNS